MSARPRPPLKSPTRTGDRPSIAEPAPATDGPGRPRDAARQGVPLAVRPDPRPADGRHPVAWLRVTAPGRGAIPTATSTCACGRDRSAVGRSKVAALVAEHVDHRAVCPLRTNQEGRAAA
ncbi:hypothetical protein [Streptomyces capitiformicae]|uniref:Uncharacterized protein n=1 Tax=Streptomyces capitiformicae TaxID=2014920 RepID=A0A919GDI2_9ACTN|nr:hypothetical protein [Streptomyces capitiformicae]GHH82822.1 hypothetical protein GCM10017771_08080 [Streptomyces capitiformicae]